MGTIELGIGTKQHVKMASTQAVIYPACAHCGTPNPLGLFDCSNCGQTTPAPRRLGTVAYYHRNPLRRLWFRMTKLFKVMS